MFEAGPADTQLTSGDSDVSSDAALERDISAGHSHIVGYVAEDGERASCHHQIAPHSPAHENVASCGDKVSRDHSCA